MELERNSKHLRKHVNLKNKFIYSTDMSASFVLSTVLDARQTVQDKKRPCFCGATMGWRFGVRDGRVDDDYI